MPPPRHRSKAFSGKAKRQQLLEKRANKRSVDFTSDIVYLFGQNIFIFILLRFLVLSVLTDDKDTIDQLNTASSTASSNVRLPSQHSDPDSDESSKPEFDKEANSECRANRVQNLSIPPLKSDPNRY